MSDEYKKGFYWATFVERQIGLVEDDEIWFVGYYEPVPLSGCTDLSLIIDPMEESDE